MRLSKLTASSDGLTFQGPDLDVTGLSEDSRKVKPGFLFIATPGTKQDGRAFIEDAIARGAVAVLVQESLDSKMDPRRSLPRAPIRGRDDAESGFISS
jgi:UDP-N-acetylmuramoyl-L-alanyl-D-glutamate--2,6-diaminopimelate ligase